MLTWSRSWKRAFLYTCDPRNHANSARTIDTFLSHPESVHLLSRSPNPFPPPSSKSKSDFESKTAAIHSETTTQNAHNLKELKADALWLSQKAGIDEITALRVTVLEWQNRSATRLSSTFSSEETSSLQNASEVDNFTISLTGLSSSQAHESDFNSEENRRLRLRMLYLSERSHVLKTARKLLAFSLRDNVPSAVPTLRSHGDEREASLHSLGTHIFKSRSSGEEWHRFLDECIKAVRGRLDDLTGDGGWLGAGESNEDVENSWRTTLVEEVLHILQLLFLELQASVTIPTGSLLLSWLRLMSDYVYLETLQVVSFFFFFFLGEK